MTTDQAGTDQSIVRLRRTLLLLSHNQSERQQIEAAGRHLAALGAAMRAVDRGDTRHGGDVSKRERGEA